MVSPKMLQIPLRLVGCFSPLLGIFLGFVFGWLMYVYMPHNWPTDVAARTFSLLFSLLGWGIGVIVGQRRRLHCGGTRPIETETDSQRHYVVVIIAVFVAVIEVFFLAREMYIFYTIIFVIALAMFAGEVGWGDPWRVLKLQISASREKP